MSNDESTIQKRAKALRKNMTVHERKLWYTFLSQYPVKFTRQYIVGKYILDFYCYSRKLAIEADGSQHFAPEGLAYDQERSAFLKRRGITVLRFSNYDIDHSFSSVCEAIDIAVKERQ